MAISWKWLSVCLAILLFQLCNGYPIKSEDSIPDKQAQLLTGIVAVLLTVCSIVFLAGCLCCQRRDGFKEFQNNPGVAAASNFDHGHVNSIASGEFTIFTPLSPPYYNNNVFLANEQIITRTAEDYISGDFDVSSWFNDSEKDFPRIKLKYIRELGKGWFGKVVEGAAKDLLEDQTWTPVAVRILEATASRKERVIFLHDAAIYRCEKHPNILSLFGRCLDTVPLLLLQEYCPQGDLKNYLRINTVNAESILSTTLPLSWCSQLTSALQHLHSNKITHPDLAARNCQLTSDLTLKVGDYGLAAFKYPEDYYQGSPGVPVRWCSPESLTCTSTTIQPKKITFEDNIWSLGVTMWEICECGEQPYSTLTDDEVVSQVLGPSKVRLSRPKYPVIYLDYLFNLMQHCWLNTESRPTVAQINSILVDLLQVHKNTKDNSMDDFDKRWELFKPNAVTNPDSTSVISNAEETEFTAMKPISPSLASLHGSLDINLSEPHMDSWINSTAFESSSTDSSKEESLDLRYTKMKSLDFGLDSGNVTNENSSLFQRTSSGSETEDENWRNKVERGAYTEKVRLKSRSVADLMILTHVDYSESESETPLPSLDYRVNYKNVRYAPKNSLEDKSVIFGSEGNLLALEDNFEEELKKLKEEHKDNVFTVPDNHSQPSFSKIDRSKDSLITRDLTLSESNLNDVFAVDSPSKRLMHELNSTTEIKPANQVFNVFSVTIDKIKPLQVNSCPDVFSVIQDLNQCGLIEKRPMELESEKSNVIRRFSEVSHVNNVDNPETFAVKDGSEEVTCVKGNEKDNPNDIDINETIDLSNKEKVEGTNSFSDINSPKEEIILPCKDLNLDLKSISARLENEEVVKEIVDGTVFNEVDDKLVMNKNINRKETINLNKNEEGITTFNNSSKDTSPSKNLGANDPIQNEKITREINEDIILEDICVLNGKESDTNDKTDLIDKKQLASNNFDSSFSTIDRPKADLTLPFEHHLEKNLKLHTSTFIENEKLHTEITKPADCNGGKKELTNNDKNLNNTSDLSNNGVVEDNFEINTLNSQTEDIILPFEDLQLNTNLLSIPIDTGKVDKEITETTPSRQKSVEDNEELIEKDEKTNLYNIEECENVLEEKRVENNEELIEKIKESNEKTDLSNGEDIVVTNFDYITATNSQIEEISLPCKDFHIDTILTSVEERKSGKVDKEITETTSSRQKSVEENEELIEKDEKTNLCNIEECENVLEEKRVENNEELIKKIKESIEKTDLSNDEDIVVPNFDNITATNSQIEEISLPCKDFHIDTILTSVPNENEKIDTDITEVTTLDEDHMVNGKEIIDKNINDTSNISNEEVLVSNEISVIAPIESGEIVIPFAEETALGKNSVENKEKLDEIHSLVNTIDVTSNLNNEILPSKEPNLEKSVIKIAENKDTIEIINEEVVVNNFEGFSATNSPKQTTSISTKNEQITTENIALATHLEQNPVENTQELSDKNKAKAETTEVTGNEEVNNFDDFSFIVTSSPKEDATSKSENVHLDANSGTSVEKEKLNENFTANITSLEESCKRNTELNYSLETWDNFLGKTLDNQNAMQNESLFDSISSGPQSLQIGEDLKPEVLCNNQIEEPDSEDVNDKTFVIDSRNDKTFVIEDESTDDETGDKNLLDKYNSPEQYENSGFDGGGGGWFLHPQTSNEEVSGELEISDSKTGSYVGFGIDDEIMAAIRNELLIKLPHAQGASSEKVREEEEEWESGERNDVFIKYNVYNPPLSPILEENYLDESSDNMIVCTPKKEDENEDSDYSEPQVTEAVLPDMESHSAQTCESPFKESYHRHTLSQDSCCSNDTLFNLEEIICAATDPDNENDDLFATSDHQSCDQDTDAYTIVQSERTMNNSLQDNSEEVMDNCKDNVEVHSNTRLEVTEKEDSVERRTNDNRDDSITERSNDLKENFTCVIDSFLIHERNHSANISDETMHKEEGHSSSSMYLSLDENSSLNYDKKIQVAPLPSPEENPLKQLPASMLSYDKVISQNILPITDLKGVPEYKSLPENNSIDPQYENVEKFNKEADVIVDNDSNYETCNFDSTNPVYENVNESSYNEADYVNIINLENAKNSEGFSKTEEKEPCECGNEKEDMEIIAKPGYNNEGDIFDMLTDIRFNGPIDNQLMSTSFNKNNDEQDWDSGSDTRSSSSGEFIWREGEHEEYVKALQAAPQDMMENELKEDHEASSSDKSDISSSDEDDDEETPEFVPSAWDKFATPTKSSLRSPEKTQQKSEKKTGKGVWFKKQKYHCVYEYPREPESPVLRSQDLWQPVNYSSYSDWEFDGETFLASSVDDDVVQSTHTYQPKSFSSGNMYQLTTIPDFGSGNIGFDDEFFISSSAEPFDVDESLSSQFFPGSRKLIPENPTPDSGMEDVTPGSISDSSKEYYNMRSLNTVHSLKTLASIALSKSKQKSVKTDNTLGGLRHTRDKLKLDLAPNCNAFMNTKVFVTEPILEPMTREKPTFTTFGKNRFLVQHVDTPPDENKRKNVLFEALPYKPIEKNVPVNSQSEYLNLNVNDDADNYERMIIKDADQCKKNYELVRGEASLLDSADEDSGIESSRMERKLS